MAIVFNKPSIERFAFQQFNQKWKAGEFGKQRYGQALYNHFNLHKLVDQASLRGLYEKDGDEAKALVKEVFKIH